MKKLLVVLAFGLLWAGTSDASSPSRGAKTSVSVTYTLTVTSVSVSGPAVVYSVILSSGAASEYVALFDAASIGALNSGSAGSTLKTRLFYSSTSSNTIVNFDPPLQFNLGVVAAGSAVTGQALIVYEKGRVTQGY